MCYRTEAKIAVKSVAIFMKDPLPIEGYITLRCVIPVVCVTNGREENIVKQYN